MALLDLLAKNACDTRWEWNSGTAAVLIELHEPESCSGFLYEWNPGDEGFECCATAGHDTLENVSLELERKLLKRFPMLRDALYPAPAKPALERILGDPL